MSQPPRPNYQALTFDLACQVDDACCRFERAWQTAQAASQRPCLDDYLNNIPEPGRPVLLRELVALDIAYRRRSGEDPQAGDYEVWFPGLESAQLRDVLRTLQRESAQREQDVNQAAAGPCAIQEATGDSVDSDAQATRPDAGPRPALVDEVVPPRASEQIRADTIGSTHSSTHLFGFRRFANNGRVTDESDSPLAPGER